MHGIEKHMDVETDDGFLSCGYDMMSFRICFHVCMPNDNVLLLGSVENSYKGYCGAVQMLELCFKFKCL